MATRKIKDAKDLSTNELIYFRGHAKATFMSDGSTVEDAIKNNSAKLEWSILEEDPYSGQESVDLGLPSGILWARCNVGANSAEEAGGYYAWGEIEEKDCYNWSTYKWCKGESNTLTKYCSSYDYGSVIDNKYVLDLEDDAAYVKLGNGWRLPTETELKELINSCTWEWTALNKVGGFKIIGPNQNFIFLPNVGYKYQLNLNINSTLLYPSSNISTTGGGILMKGGSFSVSQRTIFGTNSRHMGYPIRPVTTINI